MPVRKLTSNTPMRGGRSHGPSNAPTPHINPPVINQNPQNPGAQPLHPVMYPKQLNPISNTPGMPQYKSGPIAGQHLQALLALLKPY